MKAKKIFYIILAVLITSTAVAAAAGCAQNAGSMPGGPPQGDGGTYLFTDSLGREVELPRSIERVAPSGPLAQVVLITLCPGKLVGLSGKLGDEQRGYISDEIMNLPVLGGYSQGTLNLEELMNADPQVYIDIGQPGSNAAEEIDLVQKDTGIATIFIQMDSIESMIPAYETLGAVLGEAGKASLLTGFIRKTLDTASQAQEKIAPGERIGVFYAMEDGLTATVDKTVHSDVIDYVNAVNVAQIESNIRGGMADISMEQLILWNPDVVLFSPGSIYDEVAGRPEWAAVDAISSGRYYEIPLGPYNWMGRPSSVNRLIGVWWLADLLYPGVFAYDTAQIVREFYSLFYDYDLTDGEIEDLLAKSTNKK